MLSSAPRSLRILIQLALVAAVCAAAYLYAPPVGAVSSSALQHSLAREVGGATDLNFQCTQRATGIWRCPVHDPSVAGSSVVYELHRHGRRCWDAAQVEPGGSHLPTDASSCVGLRDQIRLEQHL